jgi:hypothetical protein
VAVPDVDLLVTTTDMKVGAYTIAASPAVPRVLTVSITRVDTADTMGIITFTGTDSDDTVITEVITPVDNTIATGLKAFKTCTSAIGSGWVIGGTDEDTITIGTGPALGLPEVAVVSVTNATAFFDSVGEPLTAVGTGADLANSTVTVTTTLDGSVVNILTNA